MIFSSSSASSSSSSSYGRRASEAALPPACPCSVRVRPCPILPLLIPHKGSSFKLLWEGRGRRRAGAAKGRAGSTEERGTRDGAGARITMATGPKFDPQES